jgi:phospholipid-binding lipoprotein MlaA
MPANRLSLRFTCLALCISLLAGCATGKDPRDPFEGFNRGVYEFNEAVDKAILKPVAEGYRFVVPQFVRSSVGNFFSNLNDVVVALNNVLQGKFKAAYSDFGRVAINSTIGILGLFDVASEAGIEKHDEDFGQTLGWWGVRDGPFIVLPFFGPSTARDTVGRVGDYFTDAVTYVDPTRTRNIVWGSRTVNRRAELLDASKVLETAALDPYEFVRDAYLQRRRNLIYDGSAPADREFLDPPPKPRSSVPQSVFPSAAVEAGSHWPDDSAARHASAYAAPVVQAPNALPLSAAAETARETADRTQPSLTQFWRALRLGSTGKQ